MSTITMSPDKQDWQEATIVEVPSMESNGSAGSNQDDEETWPITKRDLPLSNSTAIRVMDYAHVVLSKRLSDNDDGLNLCNFETSLARFLNSEIEIGKKIAFGNFADIFLIRQWPTTTSDEAIFPSSSSTSGIGGSISIFGISRSFSSSSF